MSLVCKQVMHLFIYFVYLFTFELRSIWLINTRLTAVQIETLSFFSFSFLLNFFFDRMLAEQLNCSFHKDKL